MPGPGRGGIEAADALGEAAAVARTPGIDVVFAGPYDLSQSAGHPGELDHPLVVEAGRHLAAEVAPQAALGVYLERPDQVARWREAGASFFTLRTDGQIFLDACRDTLARFGLPTLSSGGGKADSAGRPARP